VHQRLGPAALPQLFAFFWLVLAPSTSSAGVVSYEARDEWEAALVGPIYTETFDSVPPQRIDSGVGGTIATPMFDIFLPPGMVHGAFVGDGLHGNGTPGFRGDLYVSGAQVFEYNEFRFDVPIYAFGLDVGYVEDGFPGILVSVGGDEFRLTQAGSFFGAIAETPFTSVVFRNGGSAPRIYDVDNVSIAPIPEPSAWVLLAVGALIAGRR
jgi:hypothetical protein